MATTPTYEFDELEHKVERKAVRDPKGQLSAGEYNALLDKVRELAGVIEELKGSAITPEQIDKIKQECLDFIQEKSVGAVQDDDQDPTTNDDNLSIGGYEATIEPTEYPDIDNIL